MEKKKIIFYLYPAPRTSASPPTRRAARLRPHAGHGEGPRQRLASTPCVRSCAEPLRCAGATAAGVAAAVTPEGEPRYLAGRMRGGTSIRRRHCGRGEATQSKTSGERLTPTAADAAAANVTAALDPLGLPSPIARRLNRWLPPRLRGSMARGEEKATISISGNERRRGKRGGGGRTSALTAADVTAASDPAWLPSPIARRLDRRLPPRLRGSMARGEGKATISISGDERRRGNRGGGGGT